MTREQAFARAFLVATLSSYRRPVSIKIAAGAFVRLLNQRDGF